MNIRILAIGDVVGKPGRTIIIQRLEEFCRKELVDCVIANGENLAGGSGLLPSEADELFKAGVHVITGGDHIWGKKEIIPYIDRTPRLIRPANYPEGQPGKGYSIVETQKGVKVGVIHLQGRVSEADLAGADWAGYLADAARELDALRAARSRAAPRKAAPRKAARAKGASRKAPRAKKATPRKRRARR